jgi:hypothetical protein
MTSKLRTVLFIRHGSFREGYKSLDVLGWRDVELIARAIRETAPREQIALLYAPGPIASATAHRLGYRSQLAVTMLPGLLGRDGRQRSSSSFRRLRSGLEEAGKRPHVIAVTNGKLIRQFANECGIRFTSTERDLEIRRGGMVGIAFQAGSRVALRATPAKDDYVVMRDALKTFWGELPVINREYRRTGVG